MRGALQLQLALQSVGRCVVFMALSWLSRELWWCKQAAAVAVVIAFLKTAWFLQGTQRPAPCV